MEGVWMLGLTVEEVEQIWADYICNDNESIAKNLSKSNLIVIRSLIGRRSR
jgi:hypothetical protein